MGSSSSRPPFLQAQMAERRWARVGAISRGSQDRVPEAKRPRKDRPLPPTNPVRRPWKRWLAVGTAVVALAFLGHAGMAWWNRPSEADLRAGENLFVHEWTPGDPLSAGGDGLGPVFNAKSCVECHFQGGRGGGGSFAGDDDGRAGDEQGEQGEG